MDEQSAEICLTAVKQNGRALYYVKTQTHDICLAAIKENGCALEYVKKQTEEICLQAVKRSKDSSCYIRDNVCRKAIEDLVNKSDAEFIEISKENPVQFLRDWGVELFTQIKYAKKVITLKVIAFFIIRFQKYNKYNS